MAPSLGKGTRKTYSFEEREVLVNLICKYVVNGSDMEKSLVTESGTGSKRKSVWSKLTEEYNALVGPENSRSSIQLRRCWENMKANKKNRDDKRMIQDVTGEIDVQPQSSSTGLPAALPPGLTQGLPPNVVFQPKESEPFGFEGLAPTLQNGELKPDPDLNGEEEEEVNVNNSDSADDAPFDVSNLLMKGAKRKTSSPKTPMKNKLPKLSRLQKVNELHEFTVAEAQLKLHTAALLKEEARLKLEEAQYKKEEARIRMVCASYKLQKLREEIDVAEEIDQ